MERELLKGEELLFQVENLTVTNKRIWECMQIGSSVSLRTVPLGEVSELAMKYQRPIGWVVIFLFLSALCETISLSLPDRALLVLSLSQPKLFGHFAAFVFLVGAIIAYTSGAVLSFEIKLRRAVYGASFQVILRGPKADQEKILSQIQKLERALIEGKATSSIAKVPPALPNAV